MNGMLVLIARGLMVLALAGGALACGDDDDDDKGEATGGTTMTGGTTTTGGSMTVTAEECAASTSSLLTDECKACTCGMLPTEVSVCNDTCVGLIQCVALQCNGDSTDTACIGNNCLAFLGGVATATPAGPAFIQCADVCTPEVMVNDAGM